MKINKSYFKDTPLVLSAVIFMYSIFAFDRIKTLWSPAIQNSRTSNEIYLILAVTIIIFIKQKFIVKSVNFKLLMVLLVLLIIYLIGFINTVFIDQYIYAGAIFFLPIILFLMSPRWKPKGYVFMIKLIIICTLIYSVFAIILTTNFAFFMQLIGNDINNFRYYDQYRAPMMIGSSITVSYFFNLMLPLLLFSYKTFKNTTWRFISLLSVIFSVLATLILLSRIAALTSGLIILLYMLFSREKKIQKKNVVLVISFVISIVLIIYFYDLSRFSSGLNLSGDSSVERFNAISVGIEIFKQYPIFGSGMGRFFTRVYEQRFITFDGFYSLVDPHNMYILALSELGVIGIILFTMFFVLIIHQFRKIRNDHFRLISYLTLLTFFVNSIGGSHIFNEISYSIVFWITIGIFYNVSTNITNKENTGIL